MPDQNVLHASKHGRRAYGSVYDGLGSSYSLRSASPSPRV